MRLGDEKSDEEKRRREPVHDRSGLGVSNFATVINDSEVLGGSPLDVLSSTMTLSFLVQ